MFGERGGGVCKDVGGVCEKTSFGAEWVGGTGGEFSFAFGCGGGGGGEVVDDG